MNILLDSLPTTIGGVKVNTDFRCCLPIIMAFEDNDLTPEEKAAVLVADLFSAPPRAVDEELLRAALEFLNCGEEPAEGAPLTRVYSFAQDANYIYAAFRQTHGIDLRRARMHWWEFVALFLDLGADTVFCQMVGLRKRVAEGTATPEERKVAAQFEVEQLDTSTIEQKENYDNFQRSLHAGG